MSPSDLRTVGEGSSIDGTSDCVEEDYRKRVYGGYLSGQGEMSIAERAWLVRSRSRHLQEAIRRLLPEDRSCQIVDLGAGYGGFVRLAKAAGYRTVEGYDWAPEQVAAARHLGQEIKQADLFEAVASFKDESWDIVVTFDVIEHLRRSELLRCADGVRRILRSGGRWLIHTPGIASVRQDSLRRSYP